MFRDTHYITVPKDNVKMQIQYLLLLIHICKGKLKLFKGKLKLGEIKSCLFLLYPIFRPAYGKTLTYNPGKNGSSKVEHQAKLDNCRTLILAFW